MKAKLIYVRYCLAASGDMTGGDGQKIFEGFSLQLSYLRRN
jgi:hypothetical protein